MESKFNPIVVEENRWYENINHATEIYLGAPINQQILAMILHDLSVLNRIDMETNSFSETRECIRKDLLAIYKYCNGVLSGTIGPYDSVLTKWKKYRINSN